MRRPAEAFGSWDTIRPSRHSQCSPDHSQNDFRLQFRLGRATSAEVSIRWLDGKVENVSSVAAGQIVTMEEGKGIVHRQPYTSIKK
jgi:hypothetical protein